MSNDLDREIPSLLALAAQCTRHAVMITNADDRIEWVNQGFSDLTGWTLDEIAGRHPSAILNGPETDPAVLEQFRQGVIRGERVSTTVLCYTKSREKLWLTVEKEPVFDDRGQVSHFISIESDVTRYVEQKAQLDRVEQRLRDAIEVLSEGFVLYDADDRLVMCNDRYRELYATSAPFIREGRTFEEMLRAGIARSQYADALDDPEAWLARRLARHNKADGKIIEQELDDGRWLQIQERRTRDGGIVGIRADVTALKEAQIEAERARARAELASEAKSAFLATMSHELRTPMTGIIGLLDLLGETPLDETQARYLQDMKNTADGLLVILNDILDLSKVEAGRLELKTKDFDPRQIVDGTRALFLPIAETKGIGLKTDYGPDLPPSVSGDPVRLRQVLANLVGNAVKFTDQGEVVLRLNRRDNALIFEVRDTGIGIAEERLAHIFQPFAQADMSISRRYGGTGLGLTISQRLTEAMQGRISVASQVDAGSCFTVELPFAAGKATPPAAAGPRPDDDPAPAELSPLNILIAEDVELNRAIVQAMLGKHGHRADTAENGVEAVRKVRRERYDLVLMDMRMPVMDGLTATRIIRSEEDGSSRHLPIIALTADALESLHGEFLAAGIDAVITKPLDWTALETAIRETVGAPRT